jgi:hypothetical protein
MRRIPTIIEAMEDPALFGGFFRDQATWKAWRAFLAALFGLPMSDDQLATYSEFTGRKTPPAKEFDEAYLICGRRAGKSAILAVTAVFLAIARDYRPYLAPGEVATIRIMAADRDQARSIFRYIAALLRDNPMLAPLVLRETSESFELNNRVTVEVGTASFRASRGYTYAAVLCDELAFWRSDDSTNPDTEILRALRPGLLTIPAAKMLCASSPYARRGALWEASDRYYGRDEAPVLVWRAPTRAMNPTVPQADIDREFEKDPASAAAEYGAQFRTDVESFIGIEAVRACIAPSVHERAPERRWRYWPFVDPSGGSNDAMTLAICHKEGSTIILDAIRERRPPFSPEAVVEEFAGVLRAYRCTSVYGDRYGGEWCREPFRRHGVNYQLAEYKVGIVSGVAAAGEFRGCGFARQRSAGASACRARAAHCARRADSIDHGRGAHDDVANAVAGAVQLAATKATSWAREKRQVLRPVPLGGGEPGDGTGWMAV